MSEKSTGCWAVCARAGCGWPDDSENANVDVRIKPLLIASAAMYVPLISSTPPVWIERNTTTIARAMITATASQACTRHKLACKPGECP
jgi:hypothetical protein